VVLPSDRGVIASAVRSYWYTHSPLALVPYRRLPRDRNAVLPHGLRASRGNPRVVDHNRTPQLLGATARAARAVVDGPRAVDDRVLEPVGADNTITAAATNATTETETTELAAEARPVPARQLPQVHALVARLVPAVALAQVFGHVQLERVLLKLVVDAVGPRRLQHLHLHLQQPARAVLLDRRGRRRLAVAVVARIRPARRAQRLRAPARPAQAAAAEALARRSGPPPHGPEAAAAAAAAGRVREERLERRHRCAQDPDVHLGVRQQVVLHRVPGAVAGGEQDRDDCGPTDGNGADACHDVSSVFIAPLYHQGGFGCVRRLTMFPL
jgi:hypothetical protein